VVLSLEWGVSRRVYPRTYPKPFGGLRGHTSCENEDCQGLVACDISLSRNSLLLGAGALRFSSLA